MADSCEYEENVGAILPEEEEEELGDLGITSSTLKGWSQEELDECVNNLDLEKVTQLISNMMEEAVVVTDDSYDSDEHLDRPKERWAPLGAAMTSPPPSCSGETRYQEEDQMRMLEEEQDRLNNSLLSLTTHFAQVQFRLNQIVEAPAEHKEDLLKELEEFANRGIPDVESVSLSVAKYTRDDSDELDHEGILAEQQKKQQELILQLKSQLEDLEMYAYETGNSELPTSQVVEKQKVIIDQLRHKLHMDIDDLGKLSAEELRKVVDNAVGQIVNPAKVKEKLVEQLKTQIVDLERFISFLQGEATSPGPLGSRCTCPVHGPMGNETTTTKNMSAEEKAKTSKKLHQTTLSIMKQALTVLQIFAISQFGCGGREFQRNLLKRTTKGNHWGDLRAKLEIAIDAVIKLADQQETFGTPLDSDYTSDSEDAPVIQCNQALVSAVRKDLAMALRDLMQHGLMEVGQSSSLLPFGCFPNRRRREEPETKMMHAWDIFLKYYEMKRGKEYNDTPARKLSDAFSLEMVGGKAITTKQTLLSAVHEVVETHNPLKRSEDSQFKAWVCIALNEKKLVNWLRLILRTSSLIEFYYQPWSYVVKTGFDDGLASLEKFSKYNFHLPVDMAVRPFQNIKDAF